MRPLLLSVLVVSAVALAGAGCAANSARQAQIKLDQTPAVYGAITGVLSFDRRPPAGAVVMLKLLDVTDGERRALPVATADLRDIDSRVVAFELPYEPSDIDSRRDYVVEARVARGSDLLYVAQNPARVITQGRPTKALLVMERID